MAGKQRRERAPARRTLARQSRSAGMRLLHSREDAAYIVDQEGAVLSLPDGKRRALDDAHSRRSGMMRSMLARSTQGRR